MEEPLNTRKATRKVGTAVAVGTAVSVVLLALTVYVVGKAWKKSQK